MRSIRTATVPPLSLRVARAGGALILSAAFLTQVLLPNAVMAEQPVFVIPLPTPTPAATKPPAAEKTPTPKLVRTARNAVYVLVAAPDDPTAIALSLEIAMNIAPKVPSLVGHDGNQEAPMIIPAPTWKLDDLANQCEHDTKTRGAIVVGPVQNDTGVFNALVFSNGFTRLSAGVYLVDCDSSTKMLQVSWASTKFVRGNGNQGGMPLLPLGILAAYFFGRTSTVTQPFTVTTSKAPGTTVATANNGATSTTTTGTTSGTATGTNAGTTAGSSSSTVNGASTTNTTTTTATGGDTAVTTSQQVAANNGTVASTIGNLFSVSSAVADKQYPGAAESTLLRRAAAKLASDVANQLADACTGKDSSAPISAKGACIRMFSYASTPSPVPTQGP